MAEDRTDGAALDPAVEARLRDALAAPGAGPLHGRLRDGLDRAIGEQLIRPGGRLPGERVLARRLAVSRVTLRKALDALCEEGVLRRSHGARTLVLPRIEKSVTRLAGFSEDMRARGRVPGAVWIAREAGASTRAEAEALGLGPGGEVVRLLRARTADGERVAVERAAVPRSVLPDPSLVEDSLYAALDRLGARPVRGTQRLRAAPARAEDARHLRCQRGAALLCVERRCFDPSDAPVEFTETRYLGTAYDFVTDLAL